MKTIRKDWPRVREYKKGPYTYYQVDLRRAGYVGVRWKNFTSQPLALKFAASIGEKVNATGVKSISKEVANLNVDPRYKLWAEQCSIYGRSLEDAMNIALAHFQLEREKMESPFVSELLTLWLDDKMTDKLKPLRPRSIATIRVMANQFKKEFGDIRIKQIERDRIEQYLSSNNLSQQSRKNLHSYLVQFFNYCIGKNFYDKNPAEGIEISVIKEQPTFFSVEQCREVMRLAKEQDMVAYFALCLFAGIRSEETGHLHWKHINMDTREITIPASISKTKRDRMFTMSDNLYAWLKTLNKKTLLIQRGWHKAKQATINSLDGQWQANVLRHTFSTFHYAKHKNLEELRYYMGNSPEIIQRFYKGAIPKDQVEAFWSIIPKLTKQKNKPR